MTKFLQNFFKILEKIFGKKFLYYTPGKFSSLGNTAVKSAFDFWYAGDLFDRSDIAFGILNNGQIEPQETTLVNKILRLLAENEQIVFYDIGANTGYYGILAAFLNPAKTKVYSFEPLENYRKCLEQSIYLNRLENNIRVFGFALDSEEGSKLFYEAGTGSSLNKDFIDTAYIGVRQVEVKTLDRVFKSEHLLPPDFIKIDVEGQELEVLKGGRGIIEKFLPICFVEIAYSLKSSGRSFVNKDFESTFEYFTSLDYQIFIIGDYGLDPYKPVNKTDGVVMYLFLHPKKHATYCRILT